MKSAFIAMTITMTIFSINSHALVTGQPDILAGSDCRDIGPSTPMTCQIQLLLSSLPTILIEDAEIDKTSAQYQAIAIDQAARTIHGERTLIFGVDAVRAQQFLNSMR